MCGAIYVKPIKIVRGPEYSLSGLSIEIDGFSPYNMIIFSQFIRINGFPTVN
jgi:hypothetical protein